ncbi:FIG099352: hypothetical protein [hydrothermal vent metagenome]|uniref:Nickel insertion protein n=1 Tax=hydrothermal vent metagenome TaxID=652676 RepID=A0A3B0QWY0_9ZZZZ
MKILYLDCPTGISGDMCMASLIDLGADLAAIKKELKKLPVKGYTIKTTKEKRHAISGTRFKVITKKEKHHRTFKDIKGLIEDSTLSCEVKKLSIKIFKNLAVAEGKVHGISHTKVHFHEVGAIDSIVDIVGVAIAITGLGIEKVYTSPIPLGSGWVDTDHGRLPIPAPATLEVIKGVPTIPSPITMELTTPTGAVIVKTLASGHGMAPEMTVEAIGYGLGGKDFRELPNAMRALMGSAPEATLTKKGSKGKSAGTGQNQVIEIKTNIDDMNPQIAAYLVDRLIKKGALDAYLTPVIMKKGRPGLLLTVLTDEKKKDTLSRIILTESTSIGLRYTAAERQCLERKIIKVNTPYGTIRVKESLLDGIVVNRHPEFEDCRKAAERSKVPLKEVMESAKGVK